MTTVVPPLSSRNKLAAGGVLFVAYFVAAYGSFVLFGLETTIYPAAGIALAGLYLYGVTLWPAVLCAALTSYLAADATFPYALTYALLHTMVGVCAAHLLHRLGARRRFGRLRDPVSITGVVILTSAIVPIVSTLNLPFLELSGNDPLLRESWIGMTFSTLMVAPLILRWSHPPHQRSLNEILEAIAALSSVVLIAFFAFLTPSNTLFAVPLVYVLLIPLLWIALRLGPRFMTLALFVVATLAIGGAFWGPGISQNIIKIQSYLFQTELFVMTLGIIFSMFVSMEEERKDALKASRKYIEQLEHGLEETRSREREKVEFLAILAHELRNPLSPVMSSLDLLALRGADQKDAPRLISVIDTHVRTIARLLDDLLDVSRISRKRMKLEKEPVSLQEVLKRSLETTSPFIESRQHTLETSIPGEPLYVEADLVRLTQVFSNILFNAAKYTPEGGTITVRCTQRDGTAVVSVKDTGIGIPKEMLKRIFRPFTQVNRSLSRPGTGLGIGLSLTEQLAKMHGGRVTATSDGEGTGSEFTVELPLTARMQLPLSPRERTRRFVRERIKRPRKKKTRVLVVDDNEAAAGGLERLLTYHGYTVRQAHTGADAITIARDFTPEVILLDIGLPDMTGHEVARTIRQTSDPIPLLIALTGYGQEEDKLEAREAGIHLHLTKPVGIDDIVEAIQKNLDGRSSA